MKRRCLVLVLVAIICSVGFAEENLSGEETFANGNYRFASGGFWSCGQDFAGGFGEFGFNLLPTEKAFVLRDCIFVQGEGGILRNSNSANPDPLEYGALTIGDKVLFGGRTNGNGFVVRSYGFTGASVSLFSCTNHGFFSQPMMLNILFGGGFEFQYSVNTAFVIEFGGLNRLLLGSGKSDLKGYAKSNPVLTIGFRTLKG